MNLAPISEIKLELKRRYPMFKFEMKPIFSENSYEIIVYRGVERLGHIFFPSNTPMNVFWDDIREWMLPFLRS